MRLTQCTRGFPVAFYVDRGDLKLLEFHFSS
jgi:hypothetical protein